MIEWSEKWQMLFNFWKCKCLHTGYGNEDAQYTMGGTVRNTTLKEKYLGLTISADMKVSEQCGIAAAKGNQILGLIRRELIIQLYKTIVRPHLEYCIEYICHQASTLGIHLSPSLHFGSWYKEHFPTIVTFDFSTPNLNLHLLLYAYNN